MKERINDEELRHIFEYVATTSVGPSTVRGYPKDTAKTCRQYLMRIDLRDIKPFRSGKNFCRWRDSHRSNLQRALTKNSKKQNQSERVTYGVSRKVMAIFFKNCFYNRYLYDEYGLKQFENLLEVPIDSYIHRGLKQKAKECELRWPRNINRWTTIENLRAGQIDDYQRIAASVAKHLCTQRVHLDAYLYRADQKPS